MSCNKCSVNFSLFKRKKFCQECHRYFCSTCLPKPNSSSTVGRQCSKCRLLMSGRFSRDDLQTWKVNDFRCFLNVRNISTKDCREKHDLIELVLAHFCTQPRLSLQNEAEHAMLVRQMAARMRDVGFTNEFSSSTGTSTNTSPATQRNTSTEPSLPLQSQSCIASATSQSSVLLSQPTSDPVLLQSEQSQTNISTDGSSGSSSNNRTTNQPQEDTRNFTFVSRHTLRGLLESLESMDRIQALIDQQEEREQATPMEPPIRRTQLDDITAVSAIDDLSVRQLKELLVNNFVNYKGCFEKAELVEKTKRLWKDHQNNKIRAQRLNQQDETAYFGSSEKTVISSSKEIKKESTGTSATGETAPQSEKTKSSEAAEEKEKLPDATDSVTEERAAASTETHKPSSASETLAASGEVSAHKDDSICHICMDVLVDCILLECGHMVTCIQCGKRLSNCPICRQYIIRVVRVFRS